MTEVGDTACSEERVAALLVKNERLSLVMSVAMACLAVADLVTGSLVDNWRIDVALLASAAMVISGVYSRRRMAARLRHGEMRGPMTLRIWIREVGSVAMLVVFIGAVGYLLGGSLVAIALPAAALAMVAVAVAIGFRRRRRRRATSPSLT